MYEKLWYKAPCEKCKEEPDRIHSVFIETGHLTYEEFIDSLCELHKSLHLFPENSQVIVINDGTYTNINDFEPLKKRINNQRGL